MPDVTYSEAGIQALREAMAEDERVFYMGEDVGRFGGSYGTSKGLWEQFGEERVRDMPISEAAIIGYALGSALTGMRPVAEIMFVDLLCLSMDQIVNQVAKCRYMFGGQMRVPLVIRVPFGGLMRAGPHHSQNLEAWFLHTPGLKIVVPATPHDMKGLLSSALSDGNPVISFEHILLYHQKGPVPEEHYTVPIGQALVRKQGDCVTVASYSFMLHRCLSVAEKLQREGIAVEVIDLRSLCPLDIETVVNSVRKTGRLLVAHQACLTGGVGAEISARVTEMAFDYLDAPVKRVAACDVPVPFSPVMEDFVIPGEAMIEKEIRALL